MINETIKKYAVVAVNRYEHIPNSYTDLKVFQARGHALEYLNAMNTASKYEDDNKEYLLYVFESEPNTI